MIIELTPSEEARLAAEAQRRGLDPQALARVLVIDNLPATAEPNLPDPTLALFAQWEREDAELSPAEIAEENRQWEAFKKNVNAERDRAGARRVF